MEMPADRQESICNFGPVMPPFSTVWWAKCECKPNQRQETQTDTNPLPSSNCSTWEWIYMYICVHVRMCVQKDLKLNMFKMGCALNFSFCLQSLSFLSILRTTTRSVILKPVCCFSSEIFNDCLLPVRPTESILAWAGWIAKTTAIPNTFLLRHPTTKAGKQILFLLCLCFPCKWPLTHF